MTTPIRIQRKRTKGWRLPPNTVCITRPSHWGNPWNVEAFGRAQAVALYRTWIDGSLTNDEIRAGYGEQGDRVVRFLIDTRIELLGRLHELRGKNLACWCPFVDRRGDRIPCHADVLLEMASTATSVCEAGKPDNG